VFFTELLRTPLPCSVFFFVLLLVVGEGFPEFEVEGQQKAPASGSVKRPADKQANAIHGTAQVHLPPCRETSAWLARRCRYRRARYTTAAGTAVYARRRQAAALVGRASVVACGVIYGLCPRRRWGSPFTHLRSNTLAATVPSPCMPVTSGRHRPMSFRSRRGGAS
jgi:hypothetical protein